MRFLLPTGIGDSVWALHKIQAIRDKQAPGEPIDISLVGGRHIIDARATDFLSRFSFVNSVDVRPCSIHKAGQMYRKDGTYNYVEDGWKMYNGEKYCVLIPNEALERGERLENWLPHYPIRWDIWSDFSITEAEREFAARIYGRIGPFAVFHPGPLAGNTSDGHNRGPMWKPEDWVELGRRCHDELGLRIVAVGAPYDIAYWEHQLGPKVIMGHGHYWDSLIGATNLGQLWALTSLSQFTISYQDGVGIVATYLGTPTGIFWRPKGNSISLTVYLSFDERMASAWVPPKVLDAGTHLPLIYGRATPDSIMAEIDRRGWARPRVLSAT
jgi:hypothetical protein